MDFESPIRIAFRQEVTPANDDTGDWMALPATKEKLQQELERTDTDNRMAGRIQPTDIATPYSWLSDAITDEADTNELNYLAVKISELDGDGLDKLEAVIESGRYYGINGVGNGDAADIINIIDNLDSFTFHPGMDELRYGEELAKLMQVALRKMKESRDAPVKPGRRSLKQLAKSGALANVEITEGNIKAFDPVARKYGISYDLKKDSAAEPPRWLVFFRAKDADAMTAAFTEFTTKHVKRETDKPSVREAMHNFKEVVKNAIRDKTRNKHREGLER